MHVTQDEFRSVYKLHKQMAYASVLFNFMSVFCYSILLLQILNLLHSSGGRFSSLLLR